MKDICFVSIKSLLYIALISAAGVRTVTAQANRSDQSEIYIGLQQFSGDSVSGDFGIEVELDDSVGFGVGVGYHFMDALNLHGGILFSSIDLDGQHEGVPGKGEADLISGNLNLDWHLINNALTPLLSGGIGFIHYDGSISGDFSSPDAPPGQPTAGGWSVESDGVEVSYNVGAGLRWDIVDELAVSGGYRMLWTRVLDNSVTLDGFYLKAHYLW